MNKTTIKRLTALEVEAAKRQPAQPALDEWTEAKWTEYLYSWLRNGSLLVDRESRHFKVYRLIHTAWRPICEHLADGLNEWREDTGHVLLALTPAEVKEALGFIEAGYFTMTHVTHKGYSTVFYNFAGTSGDFWRAAYDSSRKTSTAIELYCLQVGNGQPRTIEEVEQFLVECDQRFSDETKL